MIDIFETLKALIYGFQFALPWWVIYCYGCALFDWKYIGYSIPQKLLSIMLSPVIALIYVFKKSFRLLSITR